MNKFDQVLDILPPKSTGTMDKPILLNLTREETETIREALTMAQNPVKAVVKPEKIEGLEEALTDYDCASDAVLGKNIDILAKAARRWLELTEGENE